MTAKINVDKFVNEHQEEIQGLVNNALNRAGDIIQEKINNGELRTNMQDILPVLLYEVLTAHTVATLRLVGDMLSEQEDNIDNSSYN